MSNIVNVYIYRLRNKIDKEFDLKLIHTIRGLGYIISDEDV
jgi:DNA-binding response OmpR family regulator